MQVLSKKLESTAIELNAFYKTASSKSAVAQDLCEEIDNHISKVKGIILKTTAEICNATNRLTEKQGDGKPVDEE